MKKQDVFVRGQVVGLADAVNVLGARLETFEYGVSKANRGELVELSKQLVTLAAKVKALVLKDGANESGQ